MVSLNTKLNDPHLLATKWDIKNMYDYEDLCKTKGSYNIIY